MLLQSLDATAKNSVNVNWRFGDYFLFIQTFAEFFIFPSAKKFFKSQKFLRTSPTT